MFCLALPSRALRSAGGLWFEFESEVQRVDHDHVSEGRSVLRQVGARASVKALANPSTLSGGKSSITAAADKVKSDLDALGSSVEADLKPQVDAVKSAVQGVETAVGNFGNGSLSENLQKTGDAIAKVGTTAGALESSLTSECPSN